MTDEIFNGIVGAKIKAQRLGRDLTQAQLAERVGVSVITVSRWERGQHRIAHAKLRLIASVLNVSVADLLPESVAA